MKFMTQECLKNIPEYMVPGDIIFVSEIPKLSNKKNDLKRLEQIYKDGINNSNVKVKIR